MADLSLALANGALALVVILFATRVPASQGKREAVFLACVLFASFIFCAYGYHPTYAPKLLLKKHVGLSFSTKELWMFADATFGCLCMIAFMRWWAWVLWFCSLVQVCLHGARILLDIDQYVYTDALQAMLLSQFAVFILIGGRGVVDLLRRSIDRIRLFGRARTSSYPGQTERQGELGK